jgi:hypothetical protein
MGWTFLLITVSCLSFCCHQHYLVGILYRLLWTRSEMLIDGFWLPLCYLHSSYGVLKSHWKISYFYWWNEEQKLPHCRNNSKNRRKGREILYIAYLTGCGLIYVFQSQKKKDKQRSTKYTHKRSSNTNTTIISYIYILFTLSIISIGCWNCSDNIVIVFVFHELFRQ